MQLHVDDGAATLYSKNGTDYTNRFKALRHTITGIPAKNAIIDCELVACDDAGMPSFRTLMELGNKAPALCLWCFDLLHLGNDSLLLLPLDQRKHMLSDVVSQADDEHLQFSGSFDDPIRLLETCQKMGFEGIVSKRRELATGPADARLAEGEDRDLAYREPRAVGIVREETIAAPDRRQ